MDVSTTARMFHVNYYRLGYTDVSCKITTYSTAKAPHEYQNDQQFCVDEWKPIILIKNLSSKKGLKLCFEEKNHPLVLIMKGLSDNYTLNKII